MSSIFSLRIVEFPKDLHQSYVLKYMFAVSLAVICPLLGLVIYTTRRTISKLIRRLDKRIVNRRWTQKWKWNRKKRALKDKWEGTARGSLDSTGRSEDMVHTNGNAGIWRRRRTVKDEAADAEKGVTIMESDATG